MSEFETKDYKPNDRELRLFEQEKLDLYKGTFVVCIVYGLSAFLLLVIILFTEWGKEFIYDKFAPAVITYILGSLIIIIYLLNAIFSIRPRKIGTDMDSDNNITCPDYWKLVKVSNSPTDVNDKGYIYKNAVIVNNGIIGTNKEGTIIPSINNSENANLQYRCEYDDNVFGYKKDYLKMKNTINPKIELYKYMPGFKSSSKAISYNPETSQNELDYIVKVPERNDANRGTYNDLVKYAKLTGVYGGTDSNVINDSNNSNTVKIAAPGYKVVSGTTVTQAYDKYTTNAPLVCNVVYPQVLGLLDASTKEKNEVSCEYAKQCGVSWSSLKCK
jgi:hypothetical protein